MQKPFIWLILAAALVAGSIHFAIKTRSQADIPARVLEAYTKWVSKFGRLYASPEEKNYRLKVFHKNFNFIEAHNSNSKKTFSVALNQFADLSEEEYKSQYVLSSSIERVSSGETPAEEIAEPTSLGQQTETVDLRGQLQQEYIQGSATCNDNYAWIAAVNMNANYYIAQQTRNLYTFSPQTYLDCSANFKNAGCAGGLALNCFQYSAFWGIGTTNDYPYFGVQRPCRVVAGYFKNKRAVEVPSNKNEQLRSLIGSKKYVVSVGVDLSSQEARFYSSGVFTGNCAYEPTTHALLVGYGTDIATKNNYWLLMSSYGTMWGEEGIMRMVRYTDDRGDATSSCGLNKYASYPEF